MRKKIFIYAFAVSLLAALITGITLFYRHAPFGGGGSRDFGPKPWPRW